MSKKKILFLSILSGVNLGVAFYSNISGVVLFTALVPLLFLENYFVKNFTKVKYSSIKIFLSIFLSFLLFNAISIWWIWNSTNWGAAMSIVANSLLMTLTFVAASKIKKLFNKNIGNIAFISIWLTFEYFHYNWEIMFPWLTLGNSLVKDIKLIQWYEYTGTLGGTLWILIINILIFNIINKYIVNKNFGKIKIQLFLLVSTIFIPITISLFLFYNYQENKNPIKVLIIQPNIDPYNEKFSSNSISQLSQMLIDIEKNIDKNVDYIVLPETAIAQPVEENFIQNDTHILLINKFLSKYPNTKLIIGASTYKIFDNETAVSHKYGNTGLFYENYNTALQLQHNKDIQIYHKSKLVIGVEKVPFINTFGFLKNLSIDLGGTTGTLGIQNNRTNFVASNMAVAPCICYESIFGEFMSEYIQNGAEAIFVITNDGWWGNTPGYKQHLVQSQARAIETRRSVARCGNTGISAIINQKGEIIQQTKYWQKATLKTEINLNNQKTFYSINGDYIGKIAVYLSLIFILFMIAQKINIWVSNKKE